jgi:hypothetical protein
MGLGNRGLRGVLATVPGLFRINPLRGGVNTFVQQVYFNLGGRNILNFDTSNAQEVAEKSFV